MKNDKLRPTTWRSSTESITKRSKSKKPDPTNKWVGQLFSARTLTFEKLTPLLTTGHQRHQRSSRKDSRRSRDVSHSFQEVLLRRVPKWPVEHEINEPLFQPSLLWPEAQGEVDWSQVFRKQVRKDLHSKLLWQDTCRELWEQVISKPFSWRPRIPMSRYEFETSKSISPNSTISSTTAFLINCYSTMFPVISQKCWLWVV